MRLIDADAKTFPTPYKINDTKYANGWNSCLNSVFQQPTIDAELVLHGHWEFKDDFGNRNYDFIAVCSRCGKEQKASGYSHGEWRLEWRYCNACGAKMFGGSNEE